MYVDLDLGQIVIVGKVRRSNVKVKCQKSCFDFTPTNKVKAWFTVQATQSSSNVFNMYVDLDLGQIVIVGKVRRSNVKVKCQKSCFDFTSTNKVKAWI